jgi:hypothetical protein
MANVIAFISGKKTYLVAFVVGAVAAAQHLGYELPPGTFELLAALGLGSLRAGIKKGEI